MSEITPKNSIGNSIKLYFFPSLVTVLAMLIWRDVSELRSDVKSLLAQSNVDKTEIQNLKRDVEILNHQMFKPIGLNKNYNSDYKNFVHDSFFKHEEIFSIDDYLPEIKEFYDLSRDIAAGTMEQFLDRCKKQYENRALHVHVFDFELIIKCLNYFNYNIIDTQFVKPYHQIVVGQKKN